MNGSGCETCPVQPCPTLTYRGSTCTAERARFGLGDPQTNLDFIRAMSAEELVVFIGNSSLCNRIQGEGTWCEDHAACDDCLKKWLQQPAEANTTTVQEE